MRENISVESRRRVDKGYLTKTYTFRRSKKWLGRVFIPSFIRTTRPRQGTDVNKRSP